MEVMTIKMTRDKIYKINVERLSRWNDSLTENHATAMLILGVTHEGGKYESGKCVVQTTEDINDYQLLLFAKEVVRQLEEAIAEKQ